MRSAPAITTATATATATATPKGEDNARCARSPEELFLWASLVLAKGGGGGGGRIASRQEWRVTTKHKPLHPNTVLYPPTPDRLRQGQENHLNVGATSRIRLRSMRLWRRGPRASSVEGRGGSIKPRELLYISDFHTEFELPAIASVLPSTAQQPPHYSTS